MRGSPAEDAEQAVGGYGSRAAVSGEAMGAGTAVSGEAMEAGPGKVTEAMEAGTAGRTDREQERRDGQWRQ